MTGTAGLLTGHVCVLGGWAEHKLLLEAGRPSPGDPAFSLYASGTLRQDTALPGGCRE